MQVLLGKELAFPVFYCLFFRIFTVFTGRAGTIVPPVVVFPVIIEIFGAVIPGTITLFAEVPGTIIAGRTGTVVPLAPVAAGTGRALGTFAVAPFFGEIGRASCRERV